MGRPKGARKHKDGQPVRVPAPTPIEDTEEVDLEHDGDHLQAMEAGDPDLGLGADTPGRRTKDERWYKTIEAQIERLPRSAGIDRRTMDEVFDRKTLMTLYKFISNGVIQQLEYPVSTGKEANVFTATTPEETWICIKIFRTSNATFHDVLQYIQGDPRFQGIKKEKRGLIAAWTQKEYRNLGRAIDVGVRVPEPIANFDNVLLMEFIGDETGPAPRLKDVIVNDPEQVAEAILDDYRLLFTKARLVHADLSEYNILWHKDKPVIIDVGQAVLLEHPMAEEFFERDVQNMSRFMTKMGAPRDVATVRRHVLGEAENFGELLSRNRDNE